MSNKVRLEKLFDRQISRLRTRGYPAHVTDRLTALRETVISMALETPLSTSEVPFLPVVPFSMLPMTDQLRAVRYHGRQVQDLLSPSKARDLPPARLREGVYYIIGTEEGATHFCADSDEALAAIRAAGRQGLTLAEIFSLAIHTDALRHSLNALATHCSPRKGELAPLSGYIPCFGRFKGSRKPFLGRNFRGLNPFGPSHYPSCAKRVA